MRKLNLKRMEIKNFRSIKNKEIDFGNRTEISGRNATGKTTVKEAYCWCLIGKASTGNAIEDIRPFGDDESDVSVKLIFDANGEEIEIEKISYLDIEKKTGRVKGQKNRFFINKIMRKAEKDFRAYIDENIGKEEDILFGTLAQAFLKMPTKGRREKLFGLVEDITDEDVFKTNEDYELIREDLKKAEGKIDDLISSYRFQINGRGRSEKGLKAQVDEIPARIDEIERDLDDTDFGLVIQKLEKERDIKTSEVGMLTDQLYELEEKKKRALDIRFRISGIESDAYKEANKDSQKKRDEIENLIREKQGEKSEASYELKSYNHEGNRLVGEISAIESKISARKKDWNLEKEKEFAAEETCPTCGQKIPKTKIDLAKQKFEERKKERCNEIASSVNELVAEKKSKSEHLEEVKSELEKLNAKCNQLDAEIKELCKKKDSFGELKVDMSSNEEYAKLKAELEQLDAEVKSVDDSRIKFNIETLRTEIRNTDQRISEVNYKAKVNESALKRREQLKQERKEKLQKIADIEQKIDLVKDFQKEKCSMITGKINEKFSLINWKLFEPNISNDGYKEVCQAIVDGANYETSLNNGSKIMAEIDFCESWQRITGIGLPIFVDNAEGLSTDNLAKITSDSQLVFMKVTDGDFKVETI